MADVFCFTSRDGVQEFGCAACGARVLRYGEPAGAPIKLTRAKDGTVTAAEVAPRAEKSAPPDEPPRKHKSAPPDVDPDGAEALGREAARSDQPVVANPFPFGDARRPRWDLGWRKESGNDGMGPE